MSDGNRNRLDPRAAPPGRTVRAGGAPRWLSVLAMVVVVGSAGPHAAYAESLVVSVVKDREPGSAAAHGLEKLTAALRAKGLVCENAATLAEAHGMLLVVAGMGHGDGPDGDLMYLIEVMDNRGNGQIYPDFNRETPYIVVRLSR